MREWIWDAPVLLQSAQFNQDIAGFVVASSLLSVRLQQLGAGERPQIATRDHNGHARFSAVSFVVNPESEHRIRKWHSGPVGQLAVSQYFFD
jgi:hypothetical protein